MSERMRGADAGFLYMETPRMHMHTLKIATIEPSPDMTFDNLVRAMLHRLRRLPALRRRIVPVPLALNHPVVVTQRRLDPARHFFRHDLHRADGSAGSMRDFEELVGRVASTPLDRSVPLWELHVAEGLPGGRIGVIGKIHHALADGIAANAMLANVMDIGSADLRPDVVIDRIEDHDEPARLRLALEGLRDAALQVLLLPGLILRTLRAVRAMLRYRRDHARNVPLPIKDAPRTSFNGPLTPRRSFATLTLPLDEMKQVRRTRAAAGALTLNDVVLAVVSGALRRWLADHDERPATSLIAGVPVGLDPRDGDPRLMGNNVSNLFTTLATDVEDPEQRLRVISEATAHAKVLNRTMGSSMVDWGQFTPPSLVPLLLRGYSRIGAARFHRAPFSAIVSNVPGPRERVKIGGAHLADVFSVGPLVEGIGLNVTVWSYGDRMNFSLLACPDLLPDVERLASYLRPALDELLGRRGGQGGRGTEVHEVQEDAAREAGDVRGESA